MEKEIELSEPEMKIPKAPRKSEKTKPRQTTLPPLTVRDVSRGSFTLISECEKAILGKRGVLELVAIGILSNAHILFEDYPGLAKTLIARTFSRALGCKYRRVQFTPDLLPADITGTYIFDKKTSEFKFRPGPIFTNILLADEINRAPPKTQAALLEAMEERQVTIEGITHKLPEPFIVMATQNPIEYEGTYPLPEAQLDRFMMKLGIGYPDRLVERSILGNRRARMKDEVDINLIIGLKTILRMQEGIERVYIDEAIIAYITEITARTREDGRVLVGASPRGSLALFKLSRAIAALSGRDYVIPDDVKRIVIPALKHRLILKPEVKFRGVKAADILSELLMGIGVPTTRVV